MLLENCYNLSFQTDFSAYGLFVHVPCMYGDAFLQLVELKYGQLLRHLYSRPNQDIYHSVSSIIQ